MSLDKSIAHGKTHRKPYYGVKAHCGECRNHGSCDYCRKGRLHNSKKRLERAEDLMRDNSRVMFGDNVQKNGMSRAGGQNE